jgi:hypothetical protein
LGAVVVGTVAAGLLVAGSAAGFLAAGLGAAGAAAGLPFAILLLLLPLFLFAAGAGAGCCLLPAAGLLVSLLLLSLFAAGASFAAAGFAAGADLLAGAGAGAGAGAAAGTGFCGRLGNDLLASLLFCMEWPFFGLSAAPPTEEATATGSGLDLKSGSDLLAIGANFTFAPAGFGATPAFFPLFSSVVDDDEGSGMFVGEADEPGADTDTDTDDRGSIIDTIDCSLLLRLPFWEDVTNVLEPACVGDPDLDFDAPADNDFCAYT